jgi:hypothetical protein
MFHRIEATCGMWDRISMIRRAPSKVFEVEGYLLIISCGFKHIEKEMDGLQVVYTFRDQMFKKKKRG